MKTILVPTDFSQGAENAITYACELNKTLNAKIMLMHASHILIPESNFYIAPIALEEIEIDEIERLTSLESKLKYGYPGMAIGSVFRMDLAVDAITREAHDANAEFIVMSSHGTSNLKDFMVGGITTVVLEKAPTPVLVVPKEASFNGLKTIVVALDLEQDNGPELEKVTSMARLFDSEIVLLHFSTLGNTIRDEVKLDHLTDKIRKESGYQKIDYRLIHNPDVLSGLLEFLEKHKPDLLALTMRHMNFFEKIFARSLSKRMTYQSHVPVFVMHHAPEPDKNQGFT